MKSNCAENSDLLLDFVYGLLEEPDAQRLSVHLAECSTCQQALAKAKQQQGLFARAALKYKTVPAFEAPTEEIVQSPAVPQPVASLPLPRRTRLRWPRWVVVATAAAVLVTTGTVFFTYQHELNNRTNALASARKQVESIDAKLFALNHKAGPEQSRADAMLQKQFLQVEVVGPANVQAGTSNAYRVKTQNPLGQPEPTQVEVKLLNQAPGKKTEQVQYSKTYQSNGELQFVVPTPTAVQPGESNRLVIETRNQVAKEVIETPLATVEPTYVTHIALNKSVFRTGDTVFFRTVTLERFSLTPVSPITVLNFTLSHLVGSNWAPVKQMQCTTGPGGIAGGDFVLASDLVPGEYRLVLAESAPSKDQAFTVRSAARQIYVERPTQPLEIAGGKKGKKGGGGAVPPKLEGEFFPEGGDLVADVANRVYYRLHFSQDVPAELQAILEDSKQQVVSRFNFRDENSSVDHNQLLGFFNFSPAAEETYRIRLESADKPLATLPLPTAYKSGVVLTAERAVLAAEEPLRIKVRGPERTKLLAVANCRGRIVDQQIVEDAARLTDLTLQPVPGCHGVMRVTVYMQVGHDWRPAAERLVYRAPSQFLSLAANFNKNVENGFRPGDSVELGITSKNETGAPASSWLYALVIDENTVRPGVPAETSLPGYFLLISSLDDPNVLEDAHFLLSNGPVAAKALDLFLGTQGWRRFVKQATSGPTVLAATSEKESKNTPADLALFTAGTNRDAVLGEYQNAARQQNVAVQQDIDLQQIDLGTTRVSAVAAAVNAASDLEEYRERPMTWLRYGTALLFVLLIFLGAVMLFLGMVVALRARSSPRLLLGSSFAMLLLAFFMFLGTSPLRTADDKESSSDLLGWLHLREGQSAAPQAPVAASEQFDKKARTNQSQISQQIYANAKPANIAKEGGAGEKARADAFGFGKNLDTAKSAVVPAAKGGKKGGGGGDKNNVTPPPGAAQQLQSQKDANQSLQGVPVPATRQEVASDKLKFDSDALRQFAYKASQPGLDHQGMLLWKPALFTEGGIVNVQFDLGLHPANYRIVIYGHTADGRLGAYQGKIEAK